MNLNYFIIWWYIFPRNLLRLCLQRSTLATGYVPGDEYVRVLRWSPWNGSIIFSCLRTCLHQWQSSKCSSHRIPFECKDIALVKILDCLQRCLPLLTCPCSLWIPGNKKKGTGWSVERHDSYYRYSILHYSKDQLNH